MKYPNLVDGASTNISVIAPASSTTARETVRGGRNTSDSATAAPARTSSTTTIVCPAECQVDAITCPSSGLEAADRTLASPSGNRIVLSTRDLGWTANGPTQTATTPSAASMNAQAAFLPSRTPISTTATTRAGHAVAFIAEAIPSARPARTAYSTEVGRRTSRANPRQRNP